MSDDEDREWKSERKRGLVESFEEFRTSLQMKSFDEIGNELRKMVDFKSMVKNQLESEEKVMKGDVVAFHQYAVGASRRVLEGVCACKISPRGRPRYELPATPRSSKATRSSSHGFVGQSLGSPPPKPVYRLLLRSKKNAAKASERKGECSKKIPKKF